jgi:pimeloyl-[acyl-carrier protein] methyl ester esterase
MRLHTESWGTGPDLFLVHGWGMNAAVWKPFADRLVDRYRVTAIDMPGHGLSDGPATPTLRGWAEACLSAAPSHAVWVGWSLGAQVALRAALDSPPEVRSLVLVAGTPRFTRDADWPHATPEKLGRQFAAALLGDPTGTLERFLALQVRGSAEASETLRVLRGALRDRPPPRPEALEDGLRLLLTDDLRSELQALQPRSLWLFGERDTLVPAEAAEAVARLAPNAEVLLLHGAAHAPFLSSPDRVARLIDTFLESD